MSKPGHEAETNQVGLVTRAVAAAVDLALIGLVLSFGFGQLASVVPAVTGGSEGLSLLPVLGLGVLGFLIGGSILAAFWALVGQTPGMRLLSIHLEVNGSREIGLRRALMRVFAVPLSLLPAGPRLSDHPALADPPWLARSDRRYHGGVRQGGHGGAVVNARSLSDARPASE